MMGTRGIHPYRSSEEVDAVRGAIYYAFRASNPVAFGTWRFQDGEHSGNATPSSNRQQAETPRSGARCDPAQSISQCTQNRTRVPDWSRNAAQRQRSAFSCFVCVYVRSAIDDGFYVGYLNQISAQTYAAFWRRFFRNFIPWTLEAYLL